MMRRPVRKFIPAPAAKMMSFFQKPWLPRARGSVGRLVLPLHGAEAADGQQPQGILGLPLLALPEAGPHADGELVDLHAAELRRQEVAQLMDGDQHAEDQDGRQDIENFRQEHAHSLNSFENFRLHGPPGRGVRRQDVLQIRVVHAPAPLQSRRHQPGDIRKADLSGGGRAPPPPRWRR